MGQLDMKAGEGQRYSATFKKESKLVMAYPSLSFLVGMTVTIRKDGRHGWYRIYPKDNRSISTQLFEDSWPVPPEDVKNIILLNETEDEEE